MIRRLAREESGWALVSAIGLMAIMLGFGLATANQVDTQQEASGVSRMKETAFNAAEAAMSAQIFALAQDWPGKGRAASPYPVCTPASASPRCPSAEALESAAASPDALEGVSWSTSVRDNGSGSAQSFYDDGLAAPGYDADGDGRLWVRSQATVAGKTRTIIGLVRVEQVVEPLPRAAVVAGRMSFSNNGNKILLDGREGSLPVASVRCTPQFGEARPCLGHGLGQGKYKDLADLRKKLDQQIAPNQTVVGYSSAPMLDAEARDRLKRTAIADGTYHATCPSSPPSGPVVWIAAGSCSWTGNSVINSAAAPGLLVIENATLYLGGTVDLHGVVYAPNSNGSQADLVRVHGNARIYGGVLIEGMGGLEVGSSKENVTLRNQAYDAVRSYVSAGLVQNTWREIVPES